MYTYSCMCTGGMIREEECLVPAPQNGYSPLYAASRNGHWEVVEALLARGADVEAKTKVPIARARALCSSRSLTHMQNAHGYL